MEKNEPHVNTMALSHMEQKYSEKFEYSGPWGNSLSGTREFLVTCESLSNQSILVQIENFNQEARVFRDNYLAVKYQAETIEFFQNASINVFNETTVFYDVFKDGLSPDLPANAKLSEFLADTRVPLIIMIEVRASEFVSEEQAEKVAQLIAASGACFYLTIVAVEDSSFGTFDRESLGEQIAMRHFVRCVQITRLNGDMRTVSLRKE